MPKLSTTIIIVALASAANAAPTRPTIPIYDAASLTEACATGVADPGTHFAGTFSHIISGYTAGYYGYMWSQVLALDMLSTFGGDLMDAAIGRRFRTTVLAQGSQKPAAQLVREFLRREPSNEAFIAEITGTRSTAMLAH